MVPKKLASGITSPRFKELSDIAMRINRLKRQEYDRLRYAVRSARQRAYYIENREKILAKASSERKARSERSRFRRKLRDNGVPKALLEVEMIAWDERNKVTS